VVIAMTIALWIVVGILSLGFAAAGFLKLTQPISRLTRMGIAWTAHVPVVLVRLIGTCELLGAAGLALPLLTGVLPMLSIVAACCLALLMCCAMVFHLRRGEAKLLAPNVVLAALCGFTVIAAALA
jgi:putative oxidoreductase